MSQESCLPDATPADYSTDERRRLIELAHRSIRAAIDGEDLEIRGFPAHLLEKRGAFTTLHLDGRLRGCVGYVLPEYPLAQTVAETAQAAAFHDTRFDPVTPEEAPRLKIEISVLTVPRPIAPEEVVVGHHGLLISQRGRRGLLLPQVPEEYGWDRETFLSQTCLKAGLPPDAWRHGATIEGFTAEVFGE